MRMIFKPRIKESRFPGRRGLAFEVPDNSILTEANTNARKF